MVIRQAGLAREIAAGRTIRRRAASHRLRLRRAGRRAQHIEEKADRIATEARSEIARLDASPNQDLVNQIEDAIDELEQAAFIASLIPSELPAELVDPLDELCAAGSSAPKPPLSARRRRRVPEGHRVDSEDALAAAVRLIEAEHPADATERGVTTKILTGAFEHKTAFR